MRNNNTTTFETRRLVFKVNQTKIFILMLNCNVVMVSPQHSQSKTMKEFLAWAKAQPKGITFGSSGVGTTPHLAGELFRVRTGIAATHVPSRGAPQTI